jgi:hypothetical protein
MSGPGANERMSPFRAVYGTPQQSGNYVLGAVIAIGLITIPWALVAWVIWTLVS